MASWMIKDKGMMIKVKVNVKVPVPVIVPVGLVAVKVLSI